MPHKSAFWSSAYEIIGSRSSIVNGRPSVFDPTIRVDLDERDLLESEANAVVTVALDLSQLPLNALVARPQRSGLTSVPAGCVREHQCCDEALVHVLEGVVRLRCALQRVSSICQPTTYPHQLGFASELRYQRRHQAAQRQRLHARH